MAATAFQIYNKAKKKLAAGTIKLGTDILKMGLFLSTSNASTFTLSTYASVSNELPTAHGYTAGGKTIPSVTWTVGASAKQYALKGNAVNWTASGGNISAWKFAVVKNSAGQAICWSRLSTAGTSTSTGNILSVTPNASGIFTLV